MGNLGGMTCEEAMRSLAAYLDNELAASARAVRSATPGTLPQLLFAGRVRAPAQVPSSESLARTKSPSA
jgi:hypothetical protein